MQTCNDFSVIGKEARPLALAAGFFDGLHLGHRQVVTETLSAARRAGQAAWVLTFDTHPAKVLNPNLAPPLLMSIRHKLLALDRLGLDGSLVLPFSRDLADRDPREFVEQLKAGAPTLTRMFVGQNWRFGRKASGDPALLTALGAELGFLVSIVNPVLRDGAPVSSTRVREAVLRGDLNEAEALLGRPFSVLGSVIHGESRGRKLGCPTANLAAENEVLPPYGVYAARAVLFDGQGPRPGPQALHDAVCSLGLKPTFGQSGGQSPALELHLLDFSGDLYGRDIEVFFVRRIRAEERFDAEDALCRQIVRDISETRSILKGSGDLKKIKECLYTPRSSGI